MAKKRRKSDKEPEEEYEFRPPEFDEKEFIKKELGETRSVIFTVVYAIVLGAVAGLLSAADRAFLGPAFLIAIAGMVSLKWVYPIFKIDSKAFQKRNWLGNIGTFFFTFLAIWILLLNQPFADFAQPTITDVTVWVDRPGVSGGVNTTAIDYKFSSALGVYQWTPRYGEKLDQVIRANVSYHLNLTAKVADNHALKSAQISVNGADYKNMTSEGKNRWGYAVDAGSLPSNVGLNIKFSAEDESGNQYVLIISPTIPVAA
jgi:hypothetical protein